MKRILRTFGIVLLGLICTILLTIMSDELGRRSVFSESDRIEHYLEDRKGADVKVSRICDDLGITVHRAESGEVDVYTGDFLHQSRGIYGNTFGAIQFSIREHKLVNYQVNVLYRPKNGFTLP